MTSIINNNPDALKKFEAEKDWQKARRRVLYKDIVCLIKGCSVDLLSFSEVSEKLQLHQNLYLGLQTVPLENIRGSVGRFDDFNNAFLPKKDFLKERWQNVEIAMMEGKTPPVELYQVGEDYFVVDGNHRVSVARQVGMIAIDAYVTQFTAPGDPKASNIDAIFIESERSAFLEKSGRSNAQKSQEIIFTCPGCYETLSKQIEEYRQGKQKQKSQEYTFDQAFADWYEEIYAPAVEAIQKNDLVEQFPERTEADLYVWTSRNSAEIESIALAE